LRFTVVNDWCGILPYCGQVAGTSGNLFPFAFIAGAINSGFSAMAYINMSNAFPSLVVSYVFGQKPMAKRNCCGIGCAFNGDSQMIHSMRVVARLLGSVYLTAL